MPCKSSLVYSVTLSDSFFVITNITTWGGDSNNVNLVKQMSFVYGHAVSRTVSP